jgi:hypothetical protein
MTDNPIPPENQQSAKANNRLKKHRRKGMCLEDRPILEPITEDLEQMADWLLRCGVKTVAMESTGVYWIP